MNEDYKKILLFFCLSCSLLMFAGYLGGYNINLVPSDYKNHFLNNNGKMVDMQTYPPVTKIFSLPFSFSLQALFFYTAILCGLIIPVLLYFNAKSFSIVWMYFLSINFFWAITGLGLLSQASLTALILFYLLQKNWLPKLFLVIASVFVHNYGLFLMLSIFGIDLLFEKGLLKNFFGGCFAMVPKSMQSTMQEKFILPGLTLKETVSFLLNGFPLPFLAIASFELWNKNKKVLLYGLVCLFAAMFFSGLGLRILLSSEIFFLFGLSSFYQSASSIQKKAIILFSIFICGYNIFSWFSGFFSSAGLC